MYNLLYKDNIQKVAETNGCVPNSAKQFYNSEKNGIDLNAYVESLDPAQKSDFQSDEQWQRCSESFYEDPNKTGCCRNESNTNSSGEHILPLKCPDNYDTGLKYLDTEGNISANICHKEPVQKLTSSILDDPNTIVKFIKIMFVSIIAILISTFLSACMEFWFKYGDAKECLVFKSKCSNIGKSSEINVIDYMFPNEINYYPYQKCKSGSQYGGKSGGGKQKGGDIGSWKNNFDAYRSSGAKCINVYDDFEENNYDKKVFPYNLADYAENVYNEDSHIIKNFYKAFCFFWLFSTLAMRKAMNYVYTKISRAFNKNKINDKDNPIKNNIIFLLLIIFQSLFAAPILMIPSIAFFLVSFCGLIYSVWFTYGRYLADKWNLFKSDDSFFNKLDDYNIPRNYFSLIKASWCKADSDDWNYIKWDSSKKLYCILSNIPKFISLIFFTFFNLFIGMFSSSIASVVSFISVLFYTFYIPLTNYVELYDIVKGHSDLLIMLFMISVLVSASQSFNPAISGIMGFIMALIIIFKIMKVFKK